MTGAVDLLSATSADPTQACVVAVTEVAKRYGGVTAVDGVSLEVRSGELMALVGPSGCGKTSLLRLVAGLVRADHGEVHINGRLVDGGRGWVPAERRNVGVVFQDHALFPHLDVADNVAFGLVERDRRFGRRRGRSGNAPRVREVLDLVAVGHLAERYPHELSGGERQRVALARALAPDPDVVLLDEPFSDLDRNLRDRVRAQTVEALRAAAVTAVLVTHDREEALAVAGRLAVMRAGRIEQCGDPAALFHAPNTRFVATFLGEADFLPARRRNGRLDTEVGPVPWPQPAPPAARMEVMVRPHEAHLTPDPAGAATVTGTEFRGGSVLHRVRLASGATLQAFTSHTQVCPPGTRVRVSLQHGHPPATFPCPSSAAEDANGDAA